MLIAPPTWSQLGHKHCTSLGIFISAMKPFIYHNVSEQLCKDLRCNVYAFSIIHKLKTVFSPILDKYKVLNGIGLIARYS